MDDLISRAAAIDAIVSATAFPDAEYIKNLCQNPANSEDWLGGVCDAINAVEEVNTVDAAPHGRYVADSDGLPVCSVCGEVAMQRLHCDTLHGAWRYDVRLVKTPYCPHCGAKMMEVEHGNRNHP